MDDKIFKSLDENLTNEEFQKEYGGSGVTSFVSWERLKGYINHAVGKKIGEEVVGLIIDKNGITVKFETTKKNGIRRQSRH